MNSLIRRVIFMGFSLLIACNSNRNSDTNAAKRVISIGTLTIEIPSAYKFSRGGGIDSYVAYMIDDKNDSFSIEYGRAKIIYRLFDYPPTVLPKSIKTQFEKGLLRIPTTDEVVYSNTAKEDEAECIFMKNYYRYDTIGQLVVKIVQPKRIGDGITGMFVPELPDSNCLSVYARNLDSSAHMAALKVFYSLKMKTKPH
jgi:hypothetical protein